MRPARALPPLPRAVLVLLGAAAYALFAWWLDRRTLGVAREAYFGAVPILLNALPGLLLALLLAALTRRPGFSLLVVAGLQALVYRIGAVKLEVLSDPIGLQDLYFITSPTPESFELLGEYVQHPWLLAGVVVAVAAVAGLAWWVERPAFRWFRATHVACVLLGIGLVASLVAARQPWEGLYDEAALRPSKFRAMPGVLHAGLMSNLVYSHIRNARTLDTLDEAALARLLAEVPATPGPVAPARPDIVIVLSESLFDPRKLEGMAALPDAIPHLRAAIAAGHGGE
ncbi:MAG TPA: hypothetical protein VFK18_01650, partial [Luteimonas sp.]|nr:hypothetical protein [Luteimonas sp.]